MSFLSHLNPLLTSILNNKFSNQELIRILDLTLLDEKASQEALEDLAVQAQSSNVAAICVYPQHLPYFQKIKPISLATVINFPSGQEKIQDSLALLKKATLQGATEIDYVFPYQTYLQKDKEAAFYQCQQIISFCKTHGLQSKIILETGAFSHLDALYDVAYHLIGLGCDFLKTSTGKISQGATLAAAFVLLNAIKDQQSLCGIKISGGIKTPQQAAQYANLAETMLQKKINASWFRIGASSLLHELNQ